MAEDVAVLQVSGTSCEHRVGAVRTAAVGLPGGARAGVDLEGVTVRVVGDGLDLGAPRATIEDAGYDAAGT